jgi:hypothetical protein
MREAHLMTDRKSTAEPVRIKLILNEWKWANNHTYSKEIEIDPIEWAEMDPYEREQHINDLTVEYASECLEGDFEILSGHDLSDPVAGE